MQLNRHRWLAMLAGCVLLTSCQGSGNRVASTSPPERSPILNASQKADVQFALARTVEKKGDLVQATALYHDVVKKDPRRADAFDRLAVIYARQEQFEQAVALHKKALALEPGNANFHCNLGYCYYLQKRWAEAELALQKAIELAPDHQRAFNNLGLVLAHTERSQQAFAAFRRAGCSEADAHNNLAFVLTLTNSWAEAKQHYVRARELGPSTPATDNGLRVVTAQLQTSQSPAPDIQQTAAVIERAAIERAPTPLLGPATAAENPSPPPPVNVSPTPKTFSLQGPISVDDDNKSTPMQADNPTSALPPPRVDMTPAPANEAGPN
jgi:Tfp pilus assembly protein PilF